MNPIKVTIAGILGVVTTLGLLFLMSSLVNTEFVKPDDSKSVKIPDIRMPDTKIEVRVDDEKPEKPEEQEAPPPDMPEPEFDSPEISADALNMQVPVAEADIAIGGPGGLNLGEGEMIPIVKAAYEYPTTASSRGIEGSCEVVFTVTEAGTVIDAVADPAKCVTKEGKPTSVFNRSSVKAALKFKYKPRVVDGKPVAVPGVRNKFVYQLEK
jgi:periplasmic protein TonB